MLIYLLKSSLCLVVFLAFYKFFLELQSMHVFKRFYLLGALVIALSIPLITFTTYVEPLPEVTSELASPIIVNDISSNIPAKIEIIKTTNYWSIILWTIYSLGVFIFGFKFIKNLSQLIYKIKSNPKRKTSKITNVLLKEDIVPHTFLRYIFYNKFKFETKDIPQVVLWHEETHARQKHSIDVLLIEILQVVFWFNPLFYFTKAAIKLNHEFLADRGVLNRGIIPSIYQQLLMEFSSKKPENSLANAINYSLIKKRFTIMKTQTSKHAFWLRGLILLPILAFTLYSFSNRVEVEKKVSKTIDKQTENINKKSYSNYAFVNGVQVEGVGPKLHLFDLKNLIISHNRYEVSGFDIMIKNKTYNNKGKTLNENIANQLKNMKVGEIVSITNIKNNGNIDITPVLIEISEFDQKIPQEKTSKKQNSYKVLNTPNKDIVLLDHWYITIEGKRYYYPYKGDIKKYYDKNGNEVNLDIIKEYKALYSKLEQLKNKAPHYVHKSKSEQEEMDRLLSDLGGMYFRTPKAEKHKITRPKSPLPPYVKLEKDGLVYYKKKGELTEEEKASLPKLPPSQRKKQKSQKEATPEQLNEYNVLAKKINKQSSNKHPIIKVKDIERVKQIYSLMSDTQKNNAEGYPDISAIPIHVPIPANLQDKATPKQIADYNLWVKHLQSNINEAKRKGTSGPIIKQKSLVKYEHIYSIMSPEQRKKALNFPDYMVPRLIGIFVNDKGQYIIEGEIIPLASIISKLKRETNNRLAELTATVFFPDEKPSKDAIKLVELLNENKIKNKTTRIFPANRTHEKSQLKSQKKATPEQIKEYNKLAKHYNNLPEDKLVLKLKDMARIRELYDLMTEAQKKNAEPLPNFPPPPPPPSAKDKGGIVTPKPLKGIPLPELPKGATSTQKKAYYKALEKYQKQGYGYEYKNNEGKTVTVVIDDIVPPPPPATREVPPPPPPVKKSKNEEEEREVRLKKIQSLKETIELYEKIEENNFQDSRLENINRKITNDYVKRFPESVSKVKAGNELVDTYEIPVYDFVKVNNAVYIEMPTKKGNSYYDKQGNRIDFKDQIIEVQNISKEEFVKNL